MTIREKNAIFVRNNFLQKKLASYIV
jgi:hypothetical protein